MKKTVTLLVGLMATPFAYSQNLLQVYEQAKENNPELNISKANKDKAYAAIAGQRASLLPQLGLSASYGYQFGYRQSKDFNGRAGSVKLQLSQTLFDYSKWKSLDIAKQQASIADIAYQAQQQALILNVANNYFSVLKAIEALNFTKAEKEAISRKLDQTKQQHKVGVASLTDVQSAQSNYDLTLAKELTAQNSINAALENLRQVSGTFYDKLSSINTKAFKFNKPSNLDELLKESEAKNLELLAAKLNADVAQNQITLAKSAHLPTLTLGASTGMTDSHGFGDKGKLAGSKYTGEHGVSISLTVPIFNGGAVSAQSQVAQYNYVTLNQKYESTQRSVINKLRSSYNNISASVSLVKAYEQSVLSAESLLKATESGYKVGTRSIIDVLNATTQLYNSKKQLSDAKYDYLLSQLSLKYAVGVLTADDLIELNNLLGKEVSTQI